MPNNPDPTVMDIDYDWSQVSDPYAKNINDMLIEYYPIPDHFQERIYHAFWALAHEVAQSVNSAQATHALQVARTEMSTVFHALLERAGQASEEEEK